MRHGNFDLLPLESRLMMSVSLDSNGWSVVTPSADTRTIYVSTSDGNDANTGLSPQTPVKSFTKAQSLVRSGMPDWVLLKSGDTFNDSFTAWSASGRSVNEPALISHYGSGALPLINTGSSLYGFAVTASASVSINYVDLIGLNFHDNNRDPNSPTFNLNATGGGRGFAWQSPGGNVLIENCAFSYYKDNLDIEATLGVTKNFTLRRDVVTNAWSTDSHAQGLYAYSINNITIYQSVFDHNGWCIPANSWDNGYDHNIYLSSTVTGVDIEQNVIANGSYAGIMARSGGIINDNLFFGNSVAVAYGLANGANSTVGGVTGSLSGNVIASTKALNGLAFGQGFDIGNISPGSGLVMANNIFTNDSQHAKPAITLDVATATYNLADTAGVNDVSITGNIVNGWWEAVQTTGYLVPNATGAYAMNNINISANDFINSTDKEVRHDAFFDPTEETYSANRYYDSKIAQSGWFTVQGNGVSYNQWAAGYEKSPVLLGSLPYPDATRTTDTYDAIIGGLGTSADFLAQAEVMSPTNYNPKYMAKAVIDYIRAGFTLDKAVPIASAATVGNIDTLNATAVSTTFTVSYKDNAGLNATTIGAGNLLVTGPNGYKQNATVVSTAAPVLGADQSQTTVVTYQFTAPTGGWSNSADGNYTISILPNQVKDLSGNSVVAGALTTFAVDLTPPTASVVASDLGAEYLGASSYSFTATFTDANNIDASSLLTTTLEVTGPNGYDQIATLSSTSATDGTSITATYTISAPGGAWDYTAIGVYAITLNSGGLKDTFGNVAASGLLADFNVSLGTSPAGPPSATISGNIFNDANANGVLDGRELPMVGVTLFLDIAGSGVITAADPVTTTDSAGNYSFAGLAPGRYTVVQVLPSGYQTSSSSATVTISVTGQTIIGINFADQILQGGTSGSTAGTGTGTSSGGTTSGGTTTGGSTTGSKTGDDGKNKKPVPPKKPIKILPIIKLLKSIKH